MLLDRPGGDHYGAHGFFRHRGLKKASVSGRFAGVTGYGFRRMTQPTHTPPSDNKGPADFEARLQKAQHGASDKDRQGHRESGAYGIATRLVAELVSGLVIGVGLGWLLDRWLDTAPWLLVTFFILGAAAGLNNVMRAARQMSEEAARRQAEEAKDDAAKD